MAETPVNNGQTPAFHHGRPTELAAEALRHGRLQRMWWPLLLACAREPVDSDTDDAEASYYFARGPQTSSNAPWDPWLAQVSPTGPVSPYLVDEAGGRSELAAVRDWSGAIYGWKPSAPLAEGVYRIGVEELGAEWPEDHAIDLTGRNPEFRLSGFAERVYVLREGEALVPPGVGSLLANYSVNAVYLRVRRPGELKAREDGAFRVPFDVWYDSPEGGLCRVLRDEAWLSPTGELWWSKDRIEGAAEPDPIVVEDLSLHLGWDVPDDRIAGAEFGATVDLRALDDRDAGICDLAASIGVRCFDCIGDGRETCLQVALHSGVLVPDASEIDWDAVPECPFSLDAAAATCQPDTDSSGWCSASAAAFIVLPLVRRRRRRGGSGWGWGSGR